MVRVPDVNVNERGVEAAAGKTRPMVIVTSVERRRTNFRIIEAPQPSSIAAPQKAR
jgi:hypothetical protein